MKELVKTMGFKDTANWVTDPKLVQAIQQLIMMVTGHMQRMMGTQMGQGQPILPQQMPPPMPPEMVQMMQLIQQIGAMLGMSPQDQEGVDFFPGQNAPKNALTPNQANQPVTSVGGGGQFWG